MSFYNVFIDEFLKKENAAQARRHLGISPTTTPVPGGGNVTPDQEAALAGTSGTPSAANKYVTNSDPRNTNARTPSAHATSHQNGGADEVNVAGLSGTLADPQIPTAHAASHSDGSTDPVDVTDLAGYPGGGTTFLRDDGTFAAPPGGGSGTVTSVALTAPSILSVAGSPVTTAGSLDLTLANQNANLVFAGPATGAAAAPTMRALVDDDIPASVKAWDVELTKPSDQTVTDNATPQNDDFLFTTLAANTFYLIELQLKYSGNNTTGDYRGRFTFPAAVSSVLGSAMGFNSTGAPFLTPLAQASATQWPTGDIILFADLEASIRTAIITLQLFTAGAGGTLQYQFSNSVAAAGRTSTTRAGSVLRVKLLA